jgi:lipoate-protein ligase A
MVILDATTDPYFNLAAEEFILRELPKPVLRLWRSKKCVIIGRHQIPDLEVNLAEAEKAGVPVLRRLSGGGAVYHDLGNLNFTLVSRNPASSGVSYDRFTAPVVAALNLVGFPATQGKRSDICLGDAKISGSAFYLWRGCMLHHGTLLFDADLAALNALLDVKNVEERGRRSVRSVHSPVANLGRIYADRYADTLEFLDVFGRAFATLMGEDFAAARPFTDEEKARIGEIADATYRRPEWNETGKI